jgi:hypothetical protein
VVDTIRVSGSVSYKMYNVNLICHSKHKASSLNGVGRVRRGRGGTGVEMSLYAPNELPPQKAF